MATTVLKSVRVRGDIKPKEVGGLDGNLTLSLNGKDRRIIVYFGKTTDPYDSEFSGVVFYKKDHGDKTDDEIIKMYLSRYPKWSIIQDPFDPNVIPPDDNFTPQTNVSTGIKYTADTTLSLDSSFITRLEIKPKVDSGEIAVKSYTFILQNPKNDDEKKVKLVIWIIDLDASSYIKNLNPDSRRNYTGTTKDSSNTNTPIPLPTVGNYNVVSKFFNSPKKNPKDNSPAKSENSEEFSPFGVSFLSLLSEKEQGGQYKGPLNTVDDYINYIHWNQKFQYQMNIYNLVFESDADILKSDSPENSVVFVQESKSSQEEVKPEPTPATESIQPLFAPDKVYTFNVEKSGFVSSPDIGTFSVVDVTPEFQFSNVDDEIPLDAEYTEDLFIGSEELPAEIQALREEETSKEIDKNLTEEDKVGSDTVTPGGATKLGDDADFWALIAVCSLEDGDDQSRADVAQSIYNRVGAKVYGSSIKKVVTATWQYEPAFQKGSKNGSIAQEWKNINSKETAIKAVMYSKGWSRDTAASALKKCFEAIKSASYQKEATKFLGGRTDFLSENQGMPDTRNKKKPSRKAIIRQSGRPNNVFAWEYNYKKNTAYDPPAESWFNKYASQF